MKLLNRSEELFLNGHACSQSILVPFAEDFGLDVELAKKISSTFGGGMGRLRSTCGALTGAFMVIGLAFGNTQPGDMETKLFSYKKVRELADWFKEKHGVINCGELLEKYCNPDGVKERKHHQIICRKLVRQVHDQLVELLKEGK